MATEMIKRLTDDLDGSEAAETVRFGIDGKFYEIDLSEANANELRAFLARYEEAGRRPAPAQARTARPGGRVHSVGVDRAAIAAWAAAQDPPMLVAPQGRIAHHIIERYQQAQQVPRTRPAPAPRRGSDPAGEKPVKRASARAQTLPPAKNVPATPGRTRRAKANA